MAFWRKTKKKQGWLAVCAGAAGVSAAIVERRTDARPTVLAAAWHPGARAEAAGLLARVGKELGAAERYCSSVLVPGEYQLLAVEAPNVPAGELKTAVGWRLKDLIDFPVPEATIDVLDIPPAPNAPAHNHQVFAVAARNGIIEALQNLYTEAKVDLAAIDIAETAQRNIAALLEPDGRGLAMLAFDDNGGMLTVTFRGELYLARRIDITLAQVEGPAEQRQHLYDRIALELQRSLDNFERQYQHVAVAKLVLGPTGGSSLHDYLSANLYLPVDLLDLDTVFDLAQVPELRDAAQQARFFTALGGALRDEGAVA
ncbi:MSHA biogenesis protein MshI [Pseudoduganella flava]|uniref:Agglutinin biogenesis protein MshI n=1 Tax=Pseudoduganella flava TaxID=871742 RepID=A0A562PI33_9BURK|nr:agglutinin biogenesis protein MshI [Pseudoduganella flava]QGZ42770.1 agglutinin biogenesis protein MshI [Pseudoduganella flava]TWI44132.1 MSHA biogenesis protein MshI [Pseudoduganella flava]